MAETVLIVDDEPGIRQMLQFALANAGFETATAADVPQAMALIADKKPDLLLLDWMLPGLSGVEMARRLKRDGKTDEIPIIMLTAKDDEADKVRGLNLGADDYVTKPFSTRELIARIQAVLRRRSIAQHGDVINLAGLKLDLAKHLVSCGQSQLHLSPTEFKLLHFFLTHPERVFTRGQLLDQVWGDNVYVEERTVDVHIRRLRKALSPYGKDKLIHTVRSVGYRFTAN
jgi:two-component system phosphate regulon response regulator PhoB